MRKGWGNNNASPFLLPFLSRAFHVSVENYSGQLKGKHPVQAVLYNYK